MSSYNIKDVSIIVEGRSMEEFLEDTEIELDQVNATAEQTNGLNGAVTNNFKNDDRYTLKFTLKADASENEYLRGLFARKAEFSCFFSSPSTGETMTLSLCAMEKNAKKVASATVGGREWTILVGKGKDVL